MSETVSIDLREIPVFERHPRVFDAWDSLKPEGTLRVVNDHDPRPLEYQFQTEREGSFEWGYEEKGPETWVVTIKKLPMEKATGDELKKKVSMALDEIRPMLQADGGDVELAGIDESTMTVFVRLTGACGGCPSAALTLKAGVEKKVKEHAPEISSVEEA